MPELHRVVISLGSNIDKERMLPEAVRLLGESAQLVDASHVYESAAVGTEAQPSYFNAAVTLLTGRTAAELKDTLLAGIEQQLGRRRTADKFAPRTIDLDIALYNDWVFDYVPADGRARHIPDPDLLRYPHVAVPVAELLPDTPHPETGEPLAQISARLVAANRVGSEDLRPRADFDLREYLTDERINR